MDWRKHISALSPDVGFSPPVRPEEICDAEAKLDVVFPSDLKELLGQSNGVAYSGASLIWSADEIVRQNLEMRTERGFRSLFMPFDALLFLGDDANGDLFFFRYSTERPGTGPCSDGTTKPTAGYCKNMISGRSWINS